MSEDKGEQPGADLLGAVDWDGESITVGMHIQDVVNPHNMNEKILKVVAEKMTEAGAGDMVTGIYDPQGKQQDVFAYTDNAIAAAIGSALNGEV